MNILFYDTYNYDKIYFEKLKIKNVNLTYVKHDLDINYAKKMRDNKYEGICTFVNSDVSKEVVKELAKKGVKYIFQRSAGINNINLEQAKHEGIKVFRVPSYSPKSIAEFAMAYIYVLSRRIITTDRNVAKHDFDIEGLVGQKVAGRTVGVIGAGLIGQLFIKLAIANGLTPIVSDEYLEKSNPSIAKKLGFKFVSLNELWKNSDYISLHAPLLPSTEYIINKDSLKRMKPSVRIVNTSRGKLINTKELLDALDAKIIFSAALDVYENEEEYFFYNWSKKKITDKLLLRLISHPRTVVSSHQAYFTHEALKEIATITYNNIINAEKKDNKNRVQ